MAYQVVVTRNILHLLASRLAQQAERLLLVDARKPTTAKVGGNARGGATAKRVENPVARMSGGKDHTHQKAQGFLGGVLAARLFPTADGWHAPHVGHLLAIVEVFHQFVVELMGHLLHLPRPNNKLCGVFEISA